jgi:hypothetical protein
MSGKWLSAHDLCIDRRQRPVIVNDKYRFVFVHIPKAAGTSIRTALKNVEGRNRRPTKDLETKHETPRELLERFSLTPSSPMPSGKNSIPVSDYLFFCFARNPWSRFCSLHRYLFARTRAKGHTTVPEDVNEFARRLGDQDPWIMRFKSIRAQADYLSPEMGFIGRYENLEADFNAIMARLGLTLELPHENKSSHNKEDYRTLLTPASAEIIARHYADDVRLLGYEF